MINLHEVEYIFTIPLKHFLKKKPEIYYSRSQMFPYTIDELGKEKTIFPAAKLGVPKKYTKPWGNKIYPIYVYPVKDEVIWGITGHILFELSDLLK